MNVLLDIFNILFVNPITNLLVLFYQIFYHLGVSYAFGFAIIALTVVVKLILLPFTSAQIKSAHKMQKMTPHLNALKEKHKGDAKTLQSETMKLYKEHGVNPAAGCLPLIVQIPFIYALYHVLTTAVSINGIKGLADINKVLYFDALKLTSVWNTTMFGLPLGQSPAKLIHIAPFIIIVPVITAVLQFILSKMMMPEAELVPATVPASGKKKEDDFQAAFQKQSLFIFPIMIGFFSYSLPLGLSLYWNTFSIFGILQQYFLVGPGAAAPWFEKAKITHHKNKKK